MSGPTNGSPPTARNRRSRTADRLTGKIEEQAGSLLGRDELKDVGRLRQRRAQAEATAEQGDTAAARREEEATVAARRAELNAKRQALKAIDAKREQEELIEGQRLQAQARAAAEAEEQRQVIDGQISADEQVAEMTDDQAARLRREAEAEAATAERKAAATDARAERLDQAPETVPAGSPMGALPRLLIRAGFDGARIPLSAIQRATGRGSSRAWPPAVVLEAVEGSVKEAVGTLLRDERLIFEGRRHRARVGEIIRADHLRLRADQIRGDADVEVERRHRAAQGVRNRIRSRAAQAGRKVDEQLDRRQDQIDEVSARREDAARRSVEAFQESAEAQEERAARVRVEEESAALDERERAISAKRQAEALDAAVVGKKARRKKV